MPSDLRAQVLAGPMIRRVTAEQVVLWLVTRRSLPMTLHLHVEDGARHRYPLDETRRQTLRVGEQAFIHLIDVVLETPLEDESVVAYDLVLEHEGRHGGIAEWGPELCYAGEALPRFRFSTELDRLLHGSCRKPHHPSGDVHYSFVYDIRLRGQRESPLIWQIVSSRLKNEFPRTLLDWFDRLNRWLYAPYSPLNWLTRRRPMHIQPRRPERASRGERLLNRAGIGYLELDPEGRPRRISQLTVDGEDIAFIVDSGGH